MHRPTGVTILALLYILSGAINLVRSWVTIAVTGQSDSECEISSNEVTTLVPVAATEGDLELRDGLLGSGAAMLNILAAAGLWTLRPWGWRFALTGISCSLFSDLVAASRGAVTPAGVVGASANAAVLVYLATPHVRRAFAGGHLDAPLSP